MGSQRKVLFKGNVVVVSDYARNIDNSIYLL